jgi:hypothetical protein
MSLTMMSSISSVNVRSIPYDHRWIVRSSAVPNIWMFVCWSAELGLFVGLLN